MYQYTANYTSTNYNSTLHICTSVHQNKVHNCMIYRLCRKIWKFQEIPYVMGTEILHFIKLESEKNEFDDWKSNLEKLKSERTVIFVSISCELTKLQIQFSQLPFGENLKYLCLSNGKFSEFFKNEIFLLFKPIPLWVMVIQTSPFFWKFTLKAERSKNRDYNWFLALTPLFVVLQLHIGFVLKTTLPELSNEYKNIKIP